MKLTMLGTGHALVTECYNTCFVLNEEEEYFLVDGGGGNGILHQLRLAGIRPEDIRTVFVTHKHLDHILGILWLLRIICQAMNRGATEGDVTVYAHDEVLRLLRDMARALLQEKETRFLDRRIHLIEVKDGDAKTILERRVTFFDIHSTKAKQFGFCMDLGDGKRLTCCGDEPYNEKEKGYAENSTWLLHEAFCLSSQADIFHPYEKHHSTVKDACRLAEALGVANLVLYHTEDRNLPDRKTLYREEGALYYHGNLHVPDDLEVLQL